MLAGEFRIWRYGIGWRYGMLFVKTILVNFLQNFEAFSTLEYKKLEFELKISMKIAQQTMIRVQKRVQ
jgi:hypothetical protein